MSATPSTTQELRPTNAPHAQSTRPQGKRANVFICYARADKDFVRKLYDEMVKTGRSVWRRHDG
jgi:hypothetical protein